MPLPDMRMLSAEQRVLRQLVEALLFEGALPIQKQSLSDGRTRFQWRMGQHDYQVIAREGAFGRVRLDIGSLTCSVASSSQCKTADVFAPCLAQVVADLPTTEQVKAAMMDEFRQTITLCKWNQSHLTLPLSRRRASYTQLEALLDEGHPYHPSFKARTGFSLEDHHAYGPEGAQSFSLQWLAIKQRHLQMNLPATHDVFWQTELGRHHWRSLTQKLKEKGGDWQRYALMPVHPWQWQQLQQDDTFSPFLKKSTTEGGGDEVIDLGLAGDNYVASQSVRTLINQSYATKAHIKLPLSMVNTSAKRVLEPHSICSAPAISQWLMQVITSDVELHGLTILPEYAGLHFQPRHHPLGQAPADGCLAAIFRTSVESQLQTGEQAIPFNALMMIERDDLPFMAGWIERYGLAAWLTRLLEVAVVPVWHLLVKHGIAIEAHGQNMILIHRDGWPERIMVRDFHESVEYCASFLACEEFLPDFAALNDVYQQAPLDLYYQMSSVELLRELVVDTLFVYNLAEVSHLFHVCYGFDEETFWALVRQCLDAYAERHPGLSKRLHALNCHAPQVLTESLMTRKLTSSADECHHWVPNALASNK
ncbi:short-chain isoprenyl diphosphate synthase [Photobacterium jeanii]|uniref:Short-chain isoprenyl diphosphate synthase n=1 Tax=Photobacterium jeanii TaxID=858640 RepID=A0A178KAR3_9GAMM|nr:IucA/IucC family protein [Photobacterium jeanii]OAN14055.1 short-chain isoprenyl diphosphate synthase [Photobacterium jeanii]PST86932.1 short-chain isoprenyl diphosphate synthase [Photobacterium jeanii]